METRHCGEQQSQSGWGDETISCIGLTYPVFGDCFAALRTNPALLLAMTDFAAHIKRKRTWCAFSIHGWD